MSTGLLNHLPTPSLPHLAGRQFDPFMSGLRSLARRVRAWRAERAEYRRSVRAERDMARLSLRTLQDIGAPEGLVGHCRRQDEHDAMQRTFWLNPRY